MILRDINLQSIIISTFIAVSFFITIYFNYNLWLENQNNKNIIDKQYQKILNLEYYNKNILRSKEILKSEFDKEMVVIKDESDIWKEKYEWEKKKLKTIEDSFGHLIKTVSVIEKIQNTDKELLSKYSKEYFLNEHFIPQDLEEINSSYLYNKDIKMKLDSKVLNYLEEMIDVAKDTGKELKIVSAYRSYTRQKNLKEKYIKLYGQKNADTFSADQGLSEHQLGTAIDFINAKTGRLSGFDKTEEYKWLVNNAYKYGFILSYDNSNNYYSFEPWHWRFVGKKLAKYLHKNDKKFYEVTQRKINEYLEYFYD